MEKGLQHGITSPEAWLVAVMPHSETGVKGFNPHPTFLFQPSSSLQAGCNSDDVVEGNLRLQVSTLIQPSGRMQPADDLGMVGGGYVFQPSSDLQAGCNRQGVSMYRNFRPVNHENLQSL